MLPPDHEQRLRLHDEVHARPSARIALPARVGYVAVLNDGVARADELVHLARLGAVPAPAVGDNYLQMDLPAATLVWERHSEFTRYTVIEPVREGAAPTRDGTLCVPPEWLAGVPGRTIAAIRLDMDIGEVGDPAVVLEALAVPFRPGEVVASVLGDGYGVAVSDLRVGADGIERIAVRWRPGTTATRAGRVAQRLLELETYRVMALRGLPVAKSLGGELGSAEALLADITAQLENAATPEAELLGRLTALAARVERATAEHGYRFSATEAYHAIVEQRVGELRERPVSGTLTLGTFMQRRLSPAMATVASTARRLSELAARIERTGALLRTRVDIATEAQNQQLLARLARGQAMQLQLQATVEGLSIAAISYYVVSLVLYAAKALKAGGWLALNPEVVAGLSVLPVLGGVWWLVRRIHARLQDGGPA